jgi:hypothetical protein
VKKKKRTNVQCCYVHFHMDIKNLAKQYIEKNGILKYGVSSTKCLNHELCNEVVDNIFLDDKVENLTEILLCNSCSLLFGTDILFFTDIEIDCPVCYHSHTKKTVLKCGHYLCIDCYRNLCFWDQTEHHPSPVLFGGPTCPSECVNPTIGRQCFCSSYETALSEWKKTDESKWNDWHTSLKEATHRVEPPRSFDNIREKCPLCRKFFTYFYEDEEIEI